MSISYSIAIDFDDDGNFTELGDTISADVLEASWRLGMASPYARLSEPAQAELLLRNPTGNFSPEIAGNLVGKFLRIQSDDGSIRTHFLGMISAIEAEAGQYGSQNARLFALGREAELRQQKVRLPLMVNFRADEAIERILNQIKWRHPAMGLMCVIGYSSIGSSIIFPDEFLSYSLDEGKSNFPFLGDDWFEGLRGDAAIEQLVMAESGRFFFNREGEAIFYHRYRLLLDGDIAATFDNAMEGLVYRYGGQILNHVDIEIRPRSLGNPETVIWALANPIQLKRRASVQLTAPYVLDGFPVGAVAVIAPQRSDDFEAVRSGGVDMTRQVQVSLLEAGASAALLEIRNRSRYPISITRLEIRGTPLIAGDPISLTVEDKASLAYYGAGSWSIEIPILADVEEALGIANWEIARRKAPRGIVRELSTTTSHHPEACLALSLFDRIRIIETQTGQDALYQIIAEEHRVSKGGTRHEVSWLLEAAEVGQFFVIGTHSIGDTSVTIVPR